MDELIDILDADGHLTGKSILKSEAHRNGIYHQTVHIWFFTSAGQVLLQQRGKHKDTHPLLYDVSVAGHIGAGEKVTLAAIREVQEEIGLTINESDLIKIGVFKSRFKHHETLIDNEFHHTYLCELKIPFEELNKQESEVESLLLLATNKLSTELNDPLLKQKYVSHTKNYYIEIIKKIYAILK